VICIGQGETDKASNLQIAYEAARKAYRAAYNAHQNAGVDEFRTTLEAWVQAWKNLNEIEAATAAN
jgi:hypothetical protein